MFIKIDILVLYLPESGDAVSGYIGQVWVVFSKTGRQIKFFSIACLVKFSKLTLYVKIICALSDSEEVPLGYPPVSSRCMGESLFFGYP